MGPSIVERRAEIYSLLAIAESREWRSPSSACWSIIWQTTARGASSRFSTGSLLSPRRAGGLVLLGEVTVTYPSSRQMKTGHSAPQHAPPAPGRDGALRHPWCRRAGPAPTGRGRGLGPSLPPAQPTARPGPPGRAGEPRVGPARDIRSPRSPLLIDEAQAGAYVTVLATDST
jgi:hypothetical protein